MRFPPYSSSSSSSSSAAAQLQQGELPVLNTTDGDATVTPLLFGTTTQIAIEPIVNKGPRWRGTATFHLEKDFDWSSLASHDYEPAPAPFDFLKSLPTDVLDAIGTYTFLLTE